MYVFYKSLKSRFCLKFYYGFIIDLMQTKANNQINNKSYKGCQHCLIHYYNITKLNKQYKNRKLKY